MNNHLRPIIRSLITEIFDSLLIQYWWLFLFFMNIDGDEQHHLGAGQVVRRSRDPLHAEGQRPGRRHVQHRSDDGQRPTGQGPRLRGHASAQDLPAGRDGHRGFGRLLHVRRADHPRHWRQRQRAQVRTARLSSAQHRRGNAQVEFWSCCRRFFFIEPTSWSFTVFIFMNIMRFNKWAKILDGGQLNHSKRCKPQSILWKDRYFTH